MNDPFVYFIRPIGRIGPIKIGFSRIPEFRLYDLMTWSPYPLEIVATIPGGAPLERAIQTYFSDAHSHREWFDPTKELVETVNRVIAGEPIDQIIDLSRPGKHYKLRIRDENRRRRALEQNGEAA